MKKIGFRSMAALLAITVFFSAAFGVTGANDSVTATVLTPTAHIDANASSAGGDDIVAALTKPIGTPSTAESTASTDEADYYPLIVLPGITHSTTYLLDENGNHALDKDGNEIKSGSFILDRTTLVPDIVKQLAFPMAKMLITQKDNGFTDAVYNAAKSAVWIQATNPDGTTANNLEVKKYETSYAGLPREEVEWLHINVPLQSVTEVIGEDLVYFFTFSIVGDAMLAAQELDEFIQKIKNETGKDKVNLLGISMGGTIFTAYAEQYREKGDISQVINVVSVLNGTKLVGDIYALNLDFSDEMLYKEFLPIVMEDATGSRAWGYLANLIIRIIPKDILTGFIEAAITGVIDQMLRCAPQFWALIPREDYPALAERWLSGEEYAYMRSRTDAFYQAQMNLEDNMRYMVEQQGVAINNICGYNLRFGTIMGALDILGSSLTSNGDSVVTVESASMGATAAPAGTQLPDSYLNAHAGSRYISPDKGLDASTCALPKNTWFFYNQEHETAGNNAACMNLAKELFLNPAMVDIDSDPERFPQFNHDCNNKEIRRWLLPDALRVLAAYDAGEMEISPEDLAELHAAMAQAQTVLDATIGDQTAADAATQRMKDILVKVGYRQPPEIKEDNPAQEILMKVLEAVFKAASDIVYKVVGPKGYSD